MLHQHAVYQANQTFYRAFNSQDLDLMREIWWNDNSVLCVHPGWQALNGWDSIIRSWNDIFENTDNLEIKLSDTNVIASKDLAWVTCHENLFIITENGVSTSRVFATNLFKNVGEDWKMVSHHASSVPGDQHQEEEPDLN